MDFLPELGNLRPLDRDLPRCFGICVDPFSEISSFALFFFLSPGCPCGGGTRFLYLPSGTKHEAVCVVGQV